MKKARIVGLHANWNWEFGLDVEIRYASPFQASGKMNLKHFPLERPARVICAIVGASRNSCVGFWGTRKEKRVDKGNGRKTLVRNESSPSIPLPLLQQRAPSSLDPKVSSRDGHSG